MFTSEVLPLQTCESSRKLKVRVLRKSHAYTHFVRDAENAAKRLQSARSLFVMKKLKSIQRVYRTMMAKPMRTGQADFGNVRRTAIFAGLGNGGRYVVEGYDRTRISKSS